MGCLDAWIEVAPTLLIPHNKTSSSPRLETIREDQELEAEEFDNESMSSFYVEITASDHHDFLLWLRTLY